MEPNIIVKYGNAGYLAAKAEIHAVLVKLGDQKAEQELLQPGAIGVKTKIDARKCIEDARELYLGDPDSFKATKQWIPADYWCEPTLEAIKKTLREEIKEFVTPLDHYCISFAKNKSSLSDEEVIGMIVPQLAGKIDADHPQKTLFVEIYDKAVLTLTLNKYVLMLGTGYARSLTE